MNDFDVIVIGAGMAGLTAARGLLERGLSVCVVEAQDRVGGRILTQHIGETTVELGAEFVHGRPPELWALIEEAGLETYELGGTHVERDDTGHLSEGEDEEAEEDDRFTILEGLEDFPGPDCPFTDYVDRLNLPAEQRNAITRFVEGFNAADATQASVLALGAQQKVEDAIEGDRLWHVRGGYAQVPEYLARHIQQLGGSIKLNFPVKDLHWQPGAVTVSGPEVIRAKQAVIAIPLAVLQARAIRFHPEPANRLDLADRLRMGQVCRFTMVFRERFWAGRFPQMSFLFTFDETPAVWWTPHPDEAAVLTGWVGGPRSDALAGLTEEDLGRRGVEAIARVFDMPAQEIQALLLRTATHDWRNDPHTRGAYSYIATGEIDTPRQLGEPVANTLFFAGEHTDITAHWGTVHAAMRSGLRVVNQIAQIAASE